MHDTVEGLVKVEQPAELVEDVFRRDYRRMVHLAGLLVGDFPTGEEIVQEAFAKLLEAWPRVADRSAYLRTVVVNLSRSRLRRLMVSRRHGPDPAPSPQRPDEAVELSARRAEVRAAIARLSRRQREAVVLRTYGGLTDVEVAAAMGVSVGTVKTHIHRAMATLASDLKELQ